MSAPNFASKTTAVHTTTVQALLARSSERLPLELALQLANEAVTALSQVHETGVILGQLDPSTLELDATGAIHVLSGHGAVVAPELASGGTATVASDVYAAGCILFEIFTGLTPAQAKGRMAVTALHTMPPASRFNPTLDEGLDELVSAMVSRDPANRPASMHLVQARVLEAFDELGLEPARDGLAGLLTTRPGKRDRVNTERFIPVVVAPPSPPTVIVQPMQPAPVVKAAPVVKTAPVVKAATPAKKLHRAPPVSWQTDDDDEVEEIVSVQNVTWHQPARFDVWAIGAVAFTLIAFVLAFNL